MPAAVRELQRILAFAGVYTGPASGAFDAATGSARWVAWKAGKVRADDPAVLAARAEACAAYAPASNEQPQLGSAVMVGARWRPLPTDVPLWVVPYHLHELKTQPRKQAIVQAILHHDAAGCAAACFTILKSRGLSTHFCVDDNGIVLQFVDPGTDVAWHAMGAVRDELGKVVQHGFNFRSVGIDLSNPVDPTTGAGAADLAAGRPLAVETIHGRAMTRLDFYPCQEDAALALLRTLRREIPTLGASYRPEAVWRGDLTVNTPGIYGHYHVSPEKIDPFGFPMARLVEVAT